MTLHGKAIASMGSELKRVRSLLVLVTLGLTQQLPR
jgi:hypothetical protein